MAEKREEERGTSIISYKERCLVALTLHLPLQFPGEGQWGLGSTCERWCNYWISQGPFVFWSGMPVWYPFREILIGQWALGLHFMLKARPILWRMFIAFRNWQWGEFSFRNRKGQLRVFIWLFHFQNGLEFPLSSRPSISAVKGYLKGKPNLSIHGLSSFPFNCFFAEG